MSLINRYCVYIFGWEIRKRTLERLLFKIGRHFLTSNNLQALVDKNSMNGWARGGTAGQGRGRTALVSRTLDEIFQRWPARSFGLLHHRRITLRGRQGKKTKLARRLSLFLTLSLLSWPPSHPPSVPLLPSSPSSHQRSPTSCAGSPPSRAPPAAVTRSGRQAAALAVSPRAAAH